MKKKIFSLFLMFAILIGSASTLNAASVKYSYDTAISNTLTSGYTYSTDGTICSVNIKSTYLLGDHINTGQSTKYNSGSYATASMNLPSGAARFTRVDGTHKYAGVTKYTAHFN